MLPSLHNQILKGNVVIMGASPPTTRLPILGLLVHFPGKWLQKQSGANLYWAPCPLLKMQRVATLFNEKLVPREQAQRTG